MNAKHMRYLAAWLLPIWLVARPGRAQDVDAGKPEPLRANRTAADAGKLEFSERVVAGGPGDFMEVRHLVLRGSNRAIGRKLAEIAESRFGSSPLPGADRMIVRAQRRYMEKNYPVHYQRMMGVADAHGMKFDNDVIDFSSLPYHIGPLPGCSVVFYPPSTTSDGRGVLSRNYDFTTGTLMNTPPTKDAPACTARPFVIEMYPDEGYPSLYLCGYDLLGAALDGVNSQGLTVAMLADDELMRRFPMEPLAGPGVGFNEIQVTRYLLDNCADVDEAKQALLELKQYYVFLPCHYIVADRHGRSFVFEHSHGRNRCHVIDGQSSVPLVTTNFSIHQHRSTTDLPEDRNEYGSFNRYRKMRQRMAEAGGEFTLDFIKETNACVAPTSGVLTDGRVGNRTLWHALYVPQERSLAIDFYLGEKPGTADPNKPDIRRSGYVEFRLKP